MKKKPEGPALRLSVQLREAVEARVDLDVRQKFLVFALVDYVVAGWDARAKSSTETPEEAEKALEAIFEKNSERLVPLVLSVIEMSTTVAEDDVDAWLKSVHEMIQ